MTKFRDADSGRLRRALILGGASLGVFAMAGAAHAQAGSVTAEAQPAVQDPAPAAAATPEDSGAIADIIVTAQRRNESLQKVPIAISAIGEGTLLSKGIRTTEDLNVLIPALTTTRVSGAGVVFIRGVGSNSRSPGVEPPVAFYVDSVYSAGALSSASTFSNIERIEVLKGPQGTLFGRNSMGGLINVITKDPSRVLTGHIRAGYANYDTLEGDAYISGPITETIAADFSAYGYNQGQGWGRNLTRNEDANVRKEYQFRSKWQWRPDVDTAVTLVGDYAWYKTDIGSAAMTLPNLPPPPAALALARFRGSIYDSIGDVASFGTMKNYGGYFRVDHDFGAVRVLNTSAYRNVKRNEDLDNDATPYVISTAVFRDVTETFSNEFQVLAPSGNVFQWQAGLYYFYSRSGFQPQVISGSAVGALQFIRNYSETINNSYSAYAQATFPVFSENTLVTLGGRYTTDRKTWVGRSDSALGLRGLLNDKQTANKFTYRAAISQQFSPTILGYASISSGFKSGFWNVSNPTQAPVRPETLTDYELGVKADLFDRRVRINLSGFYYDYADLQLTQTRITGAVQANAAQSTVYGIELEGQANVTRNFIITYGVSFLHSKYDSYPNATSFITSPTTGLGVATVVDNSGNELQRTPKSNASLGFDYVIPTSVGEFGLNGTYAYNDGYFYEPDNQYKQPSYSLVNFELRWAPESENVRVRAWIKNAFDKKYYVLIRTASGLPAYGAPGAPQTYGASVEFKF